VGLLTTKISYSGDDGLRTESVKSRPIRVEKSWTYLANTKRTVKLSFTWHGNTVNYRLLSLPPGSKTFWPLWLHVNWQSVTKNRSHKIRKRHPSGTRRVAVRRSAADLPWLANVVPAPPASDLGVTLHVKRVHLIEDERDGMLAYNAHVTTHRRQLLTLQFDATTQLFVLSHQFVTRLSTNQRTNTSLRQSLDDAQEQKSSLSKRQVLNRKRNCIVVCTHN